MAIVLDTYEISFETVFYILKHEILGCKEICVRIGNTTAVSMFLRAELSVPMSRKECSGMAR